MSVPHSLLAILDQGPCYGYQLRAEFDRRTGSTWPLNVGQIYNTLDRLERDGLVEKGDVDAEGHVYWRITSAGSATARSWLADPVVRAQGTRDEVTIKIALAVTLPGVDTDALVAAQRAATRDRRDALDASRRALLGSDAAEDLAGVLVLDAQVLTAEAELAWLDQVAARGATSPSAQGIPLSTAKPKRGRPARVQSA